MSTLNSRMRRIEEKMDVQLNEEDLFKAWQEVHKGLEDKYSNLSKEEKLELFQHNAHSILTRIELKQNVLLEAKGLKEKVDSLLYKRARRKLEERRKLAVLNDHREDIKEEARRNYANLKYQKGEPVFIIFDKQAYWIYHTDEKRNTD